MTLCSPAPLPRLPGREWLNQDRKRPAMAKEPGKEPGFPGWLTMESKATEKPEQALRRAPAYIRKQWAEA